MLKIQLTQEERVICRDFATFTERAFRDLGLDFGAHVALMNVGVDHAYTVVKDKKTGQMYLITADQIGWDGKIFTGKNERELRERY